MPEPIAQRLSESAIAAARAAIADAAGNEVFLLATLDPAARVSEVRVLARGHSHAVPALIDVARPGEVVLHNHPSGDLTPSDADLRVASVLARNGVGAYIVNNEVTEVYVVIEPPLAHAPKRIDAADAALLAPGGLVAARLAGYEHRPQQLQMLEAVAAAFNDDGVLTVEAGTGTGKSLAYLLPAIQWSVRNRERVVVSTHTINLQEQLIGKDLPFLIQQVGLECTAALVKGRGNYLCQRKAAQLEAQWSLLVEDDLQRELQDVLEWAKRSTDGSLGDLSVRPRAEVWEHVVSENDNCLRTRCPYYSTCFFYEARRAAAKADIVVVNHHLLMADLGLRKELGSYTQNGILPPARRVIIDEAHHLEDVATSYFGARLSYAGIERTFGRLRSLRHEHKGLLPALAGALHGVTAAADRAVADGAIHWISERLLPRRMSLLIDAEQCFSELVFGFEEVLGHELQPGLEDKVRIVPAVRDLPFWQTLEHWLLRLAAAFGHFAADIFSLCERLDQVSEAAGKPVLYLLTELRALRLRIDGFAAAMVAFVGDEENLCRWIAARHRPRWGKSLTLHTAPIEVAPLLRKALFEQFPTVVLTSATLAVGQRFDYLHEHVGIAGLSVPERVQTLRVASPFDFARQAMLAIPVDVPAPTDRAYEAATHEAIAAAVEAADGGTFVLFTAYGALNRAVAAVGAELRGHGFTILQQGEMNRHLLLQRFMQTPRAVLFATDSFWEGVDVRGEALRCVIIARLPFRVPTEPIEQARVEAIERRGGNAFTEHTVPQAVLKLKQGFGRLIRARSDRGAVLLLDSRAVTKSYGRAFLDSLPPARRLVADRPEIYVALHDFFA